jgi:ATP-dependent DNA helicase DinG
MDRHFSEHTQKVMRETIAEACGNEVFFLGHTDGTGFVTVVEPLARGNRDTVAAIVVATSCGDIVIHNHPSGDLTPSQADIEIASIMGNQGVGFIIIDNQAERFYIAVTPFIPQELHKLEYLDVESFYAREGILAASLKGYEFREEQVRMAFLATEAFNEDKVAIIEAGTGTGKSLAYLLPAALWATRNKERVVISTNTINLQEQLIRKDIPFLLRYSGINFKAVLVKGRSNYLCKRKLSGIRHEPTLFQDESADELKAIIAWSEKTVEGCRNDLSFLPRHETWEELCCEADQCNRVKCPHYAGCFFYTARRDAASADLLVVNHALLMADVVVRQEAGYDSSAILPPFKRLIFDEGHHLEDVATSHFASQFSRQGLLKLITKLQHPKKQGHGILPKLATMLAKEIPEELDELYLNAANTLEEHLIPGRGKLVDAISRTMDLIGTALIAQLKRSGAGQGEHTLRLTPPIYATPLWGEVEATVTKLAADLSAYTVAIKNCCRLCEKLPEEIAAKFSGIITDLKGIRGRLEVAASGLLFFCERDDEFCRWIEVNKSAKGLSVKLCFAPLEVAASLRKAVFEKFRTVVITSATLAVGDKFAYLKKRTGINLLPTERVSELLLASPFDFASQSLVGIPSDLPEPGSPSFASAIEGFLLQAVAITQGRAFILFTSYELLSRVYDRMRTPLTAMGLTPLRQGEASRHLLISRFKKEKNAVLFATDSFWEGVDVQGKALELVVITRLPFRVPTEPLLEARAEHIAEEGGDPFREYTVPQAVIKFKQGFGRLIRSRDDRGAALVLDVRVLTKNYGRSFLRALTGTRQLAGPQTEVLEGMRSFFTSLEEYPASRKLKGTESN